MEGDLTAMVNGGRPHSHGQWRETSQPWLMEGDLTAMVNGRRPQPWLMGGIVFSSSVTGVKLRYTNCSAVSLPTSSVAYQPRATSPATEFVNRNRMFSLTTLYDELLRSN